MPSRPMAQSTSWGTSVSTPAHRILAGLTRPCTGLTRWAVPGPFTLRIRRVTTTRSCPAPTWRVSSPVWSCQVQLTARWWNTGERAACSISRAHSSQSDWRPQSVLSDPPDNSPEPILSGVANRVAIASRRWPAFRVRCAQPGGDRVPRIASRNGLRAVVPLRAPVSDAARELRAFGASRRGLGNLHCSRPRNGTKR